MQLTSEQKNIGLYMAKCVTGFILLTLVGDVANILDMTWVMISMLLVLSPDGYESIPLSITRVKANLLASAATMFFLYFCPNVTLALSLAIIVTILGCYFFKLMAGSRPALAAVIIISFHPAGDYLWSIAVERVAAVVAGCAMGLILTLVFHRNIYRKAHSAMPQASE